MISALCKGVHCVDLGESFQTHISLQNLAWIQPRTSPVKFARPSRFHREVPRGAILRGSDLPRAVGHGEAGAAGVGQRPEGQRAEAPAEGDDLRGIEPRTDMNLTIRRLLI